MWFLLAGSALLLALLASVAFDDADVSLVAGMMESGEDLVGQASRISRRLIGIVIGRPVCIDEVQGHWHLLMPADHYASRFSVKASLSATALRLQVDPLGSLPKWDVEEGSPADLFKIVR